MRGEYEEEDNNDVSWQDAREDGWETAASGKAKNEAAPEPKEEVKGRAGEEEVRNRHFRGSTWSRFHFRWDAI